MKRPGIRPSGAGVSACPAAWPGKHGLRDWGSGHNGLPTGGTLIWQIDVWKDRVLRYMGGDAVAQERGMRREKRSARSRWAVPAIYRPFREE